MNPWDCRGHSVANAVSLLLSFLTMSQYFLLCFIYLRYYYRSRNFGWAAFFTVFFFCGVVHAMNGLAVLWPDFSYSTQLVIQVVLSVANLWLLFVAPDLFSNLRCETIAEHAAKSTDAVTAAIASLNETEERCIAIADQLHSQSPYVKDHPWPAWLKDENSVMLFLNDAYEDWFAVQANSYVGCTDEAVWPEAVAETFREHDQLVRDSKMGDVFSETINVKEQSIPLLVIKWPTKLADGNIGVGGMAIPIDRLQRMIERIQRE